MSAIVALLPAEGFEFSPKVNAQTTAQPGNVYTVNSTGDEDQEPSTRNGCRTLLTGLCTLRAAIQLSNSQTGADSITFDIPTTDPGFINGTWTINLTRALDDISESLNIAGPGADKLIVQRAQDATNFRIFTLNGSGTVTFSGLTITRGNADGGAVLNSGMAVSILSCVVKDNRSGIKNSGRMTIDKTVVSGNTGGLGGGIANPGPHQLAVPIVRLNEFLSDTQEIGKGVIVGQGNWQQQLENNKQAFTLGLVQRARFTTAFPTSIT
jgi:CSLREA domain-containing protein